MTKNATAPAAGGHGSLRAGELVELDYELWTDSPTGTQELLDTTREATAAKADWKGPEGAKYGPRAHLLGGEFFPTGIETALAAAVVGEEFTREFPPAEAFGERDPKLIELFSMHEISRLPEMRREDADLNIGTVLTINGRRGRVVSMTAARVRVDFNPPFAGRTVRGTFKVVDVIKDPAAQVRGLVEITYGRGAEFGVEVKGNSVAITVPDRSKFDFAWMAAKPRLIERIRSHLKPHSIQLIEEYTTPKSASAKDKPAENGAEATPPEAPAHEAATSGEGHGASHAGHAHTSSKT